MDENYLTRNYSQAETKDTWLFKGINFVIKAKI